MVGTRFIVVLYAFACSVFCSPLGAAAGDTEFQQAVKQAREGHLDRSIRLWSRCIQKDPKSYPALVNRGTAYLMTGYVSRGLRDWSEANRMSPLFAFAVYNEAFIDRAARKDGMISFVKPLEIDPDYIASIVMTGSTYLDLGREGEAAELFRLSIDLTRNPLLKNTLEHWAGTLDPQKGR
ncbi:MAG: hypothetical protein V2B18_17210 [Pseudomonadota bacterium]